MSIPKVYHGKEYLTVSYAARELCYSPATIRRWCDAGHLECVHDPVNGYRFISKESIEAFKSKFVRLR